MDSQTHTGMTLKEIAKLCGRSESTVRRWIQTSAISAGLFARMADAKDRKEPARFSQSEVVEIVRASGNQTLASLLADQQNQPPENASQTDLYKITEAIAAALHTQARILDRIEQRVGDLEQHGASPRSLRAPEQSEPPAISPRNQLVRLMRQFGAKLRRNGASDGHRDAWRALCQELLYRKEVNVALRARNANKRNIDIIEEQGLLVEAVTIAQALLKAPHRENLIAGLNGIAGAD